MFLKGKIVAVHLFNKMLPFINLLIPEQKIRTAKSSRQRKNVLLSNLERKVVRCSVYPTNGGLHRSKIAAIVTLVLSLGTIKLSIPLQNFPITFIDYTKAPTRNHAVLIVNNLFYKANRSLDCYNVTYNNFTSWYGKFF